MSRRTMMPLWALAGLLLGQSLPAATAQVGHCSGADYGDTLSIARIGKTSGKVFFVRGVHDDKSCPGTSDKCRERAYLIGGDVVLTAETHGAFTCATIVNTRGIETSGWLPTALLEPVAHAPIPLAGWHGSWKRIEADIRIKPARTGELEIEGTAAWGSHDPERVKRGTIRVGEISGKAKPSGDALFFADAPAPSFEKVPEGTCAVRMRRIASYLLVEDNKSCGGMNVSFTGIYVKR